MHVYMQVTKKPQCKLVKKKILLLNLYYQMLKICNKSRKSNSSWRKPEDKLYRGKIWFVLNSLKVVLEYYYYGKWVPC